MNQSKYARIYPFYLNYFFYIGFSTIFLNFTLYSHQYVSLSIIFISHIIIFTQSIKNQKDKNVINTFQSFLYIFTITKLFCLSDVFGKKYLNVYMDGIYLFLSKIGIISLIPLIIYVAYFLGFGDKYHGIIKTLIFHLSRFNFLLIYVFH